MADRCCDEHGCTRRQPILLRPSGLIPGRWYVLTRYTREQREGQPDLIVSDQKHQLDDRSAAVLTRWREAVDVLTELVRLGSLNPADRAAERAAWERARQVVAALEAGDG